VNETEWVDSILLSPQRFVFLVAKKFQCSPIRSPMIRLRGVIIVGDKDITKEEGLNRKNTSAMLEGDLLLSFP
jgi:hypothetical protein